MDTTTFKTLDTKPVMHSGHEVTAVGHVHMKPLYGGLPEKESVWVWVKDSTHPEADTDGVHMVACDMRGVPIMSVDAKRYKKLILESKYAQRINWVQKHFKNMSRLSDEIGVSVPSVSRWMREKPTRFLQHIDVLKKSGDSVETIVEIFS
jgi:hypothetical protein